MQIQIVQLSVVKIVDELNFYAQISTAKPLWSSGKTLAANAGNRGFESHRGQNLFFTVYSIIRVNCEELF